jgi:KaiC/GvpD/RAD55 family RecA-like ATPase
MTQRGRNYPTDNLITAIEHEITAILDSSGSADERITLSQGRLIRTQGIDHEYAFAVRGWRNTGNDQFLVRPSRTQGDWVQATASVMPDGKLRLTTKGELAGDLAQVQLRPDETLPLSRLAERIREHAGTFNKTAASWIIGDGSPKIGRCSEVERLVRGYAGLRLNERQRLAIEHALASEITFVWGPPGTGKTDVVSRIIEGCYRQGLRVLFVAPTHVAVDQALERVCELLRHEEQFDSGLVQRAGEIAIPSLKTRFGPKIVASEIADALTAELVTRIDEIKARLAQVCADIELHQRVIAAMRERDALAGRFGPLARLLHELDAKANAADEAVARAQVMLDRMGDPASLTRAKKREKYDARLAEVRYRRATAAGHRNERDNTERDRQTCSAQLEALTSRLSSDVARVSSVPPLDRLKATEQNLGNRLSVLEKERSDIAATVRDRCRIMGTTVAKAVQSGALMSSIDVVIIDEVGMVALPSAWYAAGLAAQRVVLAGDFRQLPPVTHGSGNRKASAQDRAHSGMWMDRDAFTAAGLVDAAGRARPDARMICLDAQYRMRAEICAVVNAVAYPDSPLRTARDETGHVPESPLLPGSLVLIDTTDRRVPFPRGRRDAHTSNPVHEAVIHELVRGLQYDTVLPARKAEVPEGERATDRLAVITPYRAQVRALKASLRHRFGEPYDGLADTVHRFQGSQRPVVIIDTVAGAGEKLGMFYEGTGLSSTTCRLLNVALSRAQDHLVVIADVRFLREHLAPNSEAAAMLDYLTARAHRLPVDDLVPIRAASDLSGLSVEELARPAFFPADEVVRAVAWDIERAARSVEIYCPFLDRTPVRQWLRRLEPRIAAGIQVTVHTRPPEDRPAAAELVADLREVGCAVSLHERMHEKVMIVDETVLWHGSLNLLAGVGPTDLMMRITDASACERVRRIMDRARRDQPLAHRAARPAGRPDSTRSEQGVGPGDVKDGRLYLNVPFEEKDEAKRAVRARWDRERKLWHVDAATPRTQVARWLPAGQ